MTNLFIFQKQNQVNSLRLVQTNMYAGFDITSLKSYEEPEFTYNADSTGVSTYRVFSSVSWNSDRLDI